VARLRDPRGRPALHTRLLAALVVLGLVAISAPAVIPVLHWAIEQALP